MCGGSEGTFCFPDKRIRCKQTALLSSPLLVLAVGGMAGGLVTFCNHDGKPEEISE